MCLLCIGKESKAVVANDRPMKALSVHNTKAILGKVVLVLIAVILEAKYRIVLSKAVVEVDRPMKVQSVHIQKPY